MSLEPPFPSSLSRGGTALAAAAVVVGLASPARAVERENHLGVDLGGSALIVSDKSAPDIGPSFGAHWAYGLNDAFNLMVEAAWSLASATDRPGPKIPSTRPAWVANAQVGVGYVFDVLQWVPYAGLLIGGDALSGGTLDHATILPRVIIALGLDYRLEPNLTVGIALRQHVMPADVFESSTYPSFTQAYLRGEYTWGW